MEPGQVICAVGPGATKRHPIAIRFLDDRGRWSERYLSRHEAGTIAENLLRAIENVEKGKWRTAE